MEPNPTTKGLLVEVLSSRYSMGIAAIDAVIVGPGVTAYDRVFTATERVPGINIVPGNLFGTVKAVPVDGPDSRLAHVSGRRADEMAGGNINYVTSFQGPMFGGSYITTSDSRLQGIIERVLADSWYRDVADAIRRSDGKSGLVRAVARAYGAVPLHNAYQASAIRRTSATRPGISS